MWIGAERVVIGEEDIVGGWMDDQPFEVPLGILGEFSECQQRVKSTDCDVNS